MLVHLSVKGTCCLSSINRVTSDPPMPPQEALQVLFTGNTLVPGIDITISWSDIEGELAQDFFKLFLT